VLCLASELRLGSYRTGEPEATVRLSRSEALIPSFVVVNLDTISALPVQALQLNPHEKRGLQFSRVMLALVPYIWKNFLRQLLFFPPDYSAEDGGQGEGDGR
jgi:hypothetical protein